MRLRIVSHLVTHAGREPDDPAVLKLCLELARKTQQDMSLAAPVIGKISSGIFDHADTHIAKLLHSRCGSTGVAGTCGARDRLPVGGAKRNVLKVHGVVVRL